MEDIVKEIAMAPIQGQGIEREMRIEKALVEANSTIRILEDGLRHDEDTTYNDGQVVSALQELTTAVGEMHKAFKQQKLYTKVELPPSKTDHAGCSCCNCRKY